MVELTLIKYQLALKQAAEECKNAESDLSFKTALFQVVHNLSCIATIDGELYNAVDEIQNAISPTNKDFLTGNIEALKAQIKNPPYWKDEKARIMPILDTLKERGLSA